MRCEPLHNQGRRQVKKEWRWRALEKDKPCLTKMMILSLACVVSGERMPDREWVQSNGRTENSGMRKEDELRLDSWIQIRSTG